jgi:signal transduction histidine kinase
MNPDDLFRRYQELQRYVGWTDEDARRIRSVADVLEAHLVPLIDDFYAEIERHPEASKVITGGSVQMERLKGTLRAWLRELLFGPYDRDYVARRWRVGWRHVEIGLDQVYTNVALSRLRRGLFKFLELRPEDSQDGMALRRSLNLLLDLDLAIIQDAYQTEYLARQQRSERMAATGQIAGGIAQELRNPLNTVRTSAYILLNTRNLPQAKIAEHLGRIERHAVVADDVITALSNFAKMPPPNPRPFQVEKFVQEVLQLNPVPEKIAVTIDCPSKVPPALADVDQMRMVFGNLIRSGCEAMPRGGRLSIQSRLAGESVEIQVADNGMGTTEETLGRGESPVTTKDRSQGLGMAIVKAIVDKNKGSLQINSQVGRGTACVVRLPAAGNES